MCQVESVRSGPCPTLVHYFIRKDMRTQAYEPGGWELQPPHSGKPIIFRAKAKFLGQKPAAKNEKNLYLLSEENGIHSV